MWFKNKIKEWWVKLKEEFISPFLGVSAIAIAFLYFIDADPIIFDEDTLLVWAFAFLIGAFLNWYFFKAKTKVRESGRWIVNITFPATLATILFFQASGVKVIEDLGVYIIVFFVAQCVVLLDGHHLARGESSTEKLQDGAHLAIAAIMFLGVFLCAREAYSTPTISVDEAHSSNAASGILTRGFPYFPNTEVIYSRSWVDLYSIALSYKLFGINEFSARLPSIVAYTLSISLLYLILRRTIASKAMSLIVMALFALNPWILHYGAYARMYIFLLLFSMIFAYLLIRYLQTKERKVLYIFLPLAILGGLFSERSFMIFAPPYALLILFSLPRTWQFWKKAFVRVGAPVVVLTGIVSLTFYDQVASFVERYLIGFGGGGGLLEYARVAYTPLEWLSFYGLPTILLILSTIVILLRGNARDRIILALFWFGEFLVDILVYSNFPSRRFNYSFILVSLYTLVIVFGLTTLYRILPKWQKITLTSFIVIFCGYHYLFSYSFPVYADFGKIQQIPENSLVLGYPTSPTVFYNMKYNRGNDIRPFITDRIEMNKYVQNGTEIYSGGVPVIGVTPLNALRATQDVYLFYEKTRFSFLNERTETYIFENCAPIDKQVAKDVAFHIANNYQFSEEDGETRNTLVALKCSQLEIIDK